MSVEQSAAPRELTPSAMVAMLTLQLRAELQAAEQAEAAAAALEPDAALAQLRERLNPMIEDRRHELDEATREIRAASTAAIAAAQREATERIHQARAEREARRLVVTPSPADVGSDVTCELPAVGPEVQPQARDRVADVEHPAIDEVAEAADVLDVAGVPDLADGADIARGADVTEIAVTDLHDAHRYAAPPAAPIAPTSESQAAASAAPVPALVTMDAEVFARIFAATLAAILDERLLQRGISAAPMPVVFPSQRRRSSWRDALHLDVLLLGVATLIVLVVVVAWMA